METTVKTYKKTRDYERDLKHMQRDGWSLVNVVSKPTRRGCLIIYPGKPELIATYQRERNI